MAQDAMKVSGQLKEQFQKERAVYVRRISALQSCLRHTMEDCHQIAERGGQGRLISLAMETITRRIDVALIEDDQVKD